MQRILLARECGEDACGLEDVYLDEWTNLQMDEPREHVAMFADELNFMDIDAVHGSLLLCGGSTWAGRGSEVLGSVGVFQVEPPGKKPVKEAVVFSTDQKIVGGALCCGSWLPEDPGLFVTGNTNSEISVWDTSCFNVALRIQLDLGEVETGNVTALHMSSVPGAKSELVATARTTSRDINLLDLGSGACTHRLEGHAGYVTDVKWSPTNPYMLASCGTDGGVRLFDVRRSGKLACLVEFDDYKAFPDQAWNVQTRESSSNQMPRKRPKPAQRNSARKRTDSVPLRRITVLGLGCAWESPSAAQDRWRKRRLETVKHIGLLGGSSTSRIRFSPNGTTLISSGIDLLLRLWDVHTGTFLKAHRQKQSKLLFAIARDNYHFFTNDLGALRICDIEDGVQIWQRHGHVRTMSEMVVHPLRQEIYTASGSQIICWSPSTPVEV